MKEDIINEQMESVRQALSNAYDEGYKDGVASVQPTPSPSPSPEQPTEQDLGKLLHKVGLMGDLHFDVSDNKGTEYAGDLINALAYFRNQGVAFIASMGDYGQYDEKDWQQFQEYYNAHAWAPTRGELRLFTAVGNHDSYLLTSKQLIGSEDKDVWIGRHKRYWNDFTGEECKDMHFFEYGGHWDKQYAFKRTNQSKLSYWYERDDVMYVFLAVDYGEDPDLCWGMMTQAVNKLDYNDPYVRAMERVVDGLTDYKRETEDRFNYQFYHPNLIWWLYELIVDNPDKRIVISMHHFFPQKAGNGTKRTANGNYYSKGRLWPYSDEFRASTTKANSNTLCGLEFYFLNRLANNYMNTVWISGHSHFAWEDEDKCMDVCFYDFDIYNPDGKERMTDYGKAENYGEFVYTRVSDTPRIDSAPCIHLPSLSKPADRAFNESLPGASQGGILEVYEHGMVLSEIVFKKQGDMTYCNKEHKRIIWQNE